VSKFTRYALLAVFPLMLAAAPATADSQVTLKAFEGYNFAKHAVMKSGDANADVSFAVGKQSGALTARKIKPLGSNLPDASAFMGVQQWPAAIDNPMPGYYAVQGHDGRSIYLVQLLSYDNPGRPTHWQMSFTWEQLQ